MKNQRQDKYSIIKPPAYYSRFIIDFFYSKNNKTQIFDKLLNKMYEEYFSAIQMEKFEKARWINIKTWLLLIHAAFIQIPFSKFKGVILLLFLT